MNKVKNFFQKIDPTILATCYLLSTLIASLCMATFRILILPGAKEFKIQTFATSSVCTAFNVVLAILIVAIFCLKFTLHFVEKPHPPRHFHRDLPGKEQTEPHTPLHAHRPPLPRPFMPSSIRLFSLLLAITSLVCAIVAFIDASRATNVVFFYYLLAVAAVFNAAYFFYITLVRNRCFPGMIYLSLVPVLFSALRLLENFIRVSTYASAGFHASELLCSCAVTLFFLYEARMYLPNRRQWKPELHFIFACISILTIASDVLPRIYSVVFLSYSDPQLYFALFDLVLLFSLTQRLVVPHTRHNANSAK